MKLKGNVTSGGKLYVPPAPSQHHTMTVGEYDIYGGSMAYGYSDILGMGGVTPNTFDFSDETMEIERIYHTLAGTPNFYIYLYSATDRNAGWESVEINGTSFNRASFSYGYTSSIGIGARHWIKSSVPLPPFPHTVGTEVSIKWTL